MMSRTSFRFPVLLLMFCSLARLCDAMKGKGAAVSMPCPRGHSLKASTIFPWQSFQCDSCGKSRTANSTVTRWECQACDWNMCQACKVKYYEVPKNRAREQAQARERERAQARQKKLQADADARVAKTFPKCPRGHSLKDSTFVPWQCFQCDSCGKKVTNRTNGTLTKWECQACDWNMCHACKVSEKWRTARTASAAKSQRIAHASKLQARQRERAQARQKKLQADADARVANTCLTARKAEEIRQINLKKIAASGSVRCPKGCRLSDEEKTTILRENSQFCPKFRCRGELVYPSDSFGSGNQLRRKHEQALARLEVGDRIEVTKYDVVGGRWCPATYQGKGRDNCDLDFSKAIHCVAVAYDDMPSKILYVAGFRVRPRK